MAYYKFQTLVNYSEIAILEQVVNISQALMKSHEKNNNSDVNNTSSQA